MTFFHPTSSDMWRKKPRNSASPILPLDSSTLLADQKLSGFRCIGVFIQRHKLSLVLGSRRTREWHQLGNHSHEKEVGRSCVDMSFKGKTVLNTLKTHFL
ncbi:hypothetical protein OIU84_023722 [Salix udensis]|uniref:Uncharacterized protein n=1 Tax=Salix udensis TaxID=889485 RepID=A0AAD6KRN0_9ROSI|nr:hypothetical protein OIU84_023722 [Salix udensis]